MATPSHFLNQIKDQFYKTKIELAIEWETHEHEMRGPQISLYIIFNEHKISKIIYEMRFVMIAIKQIFFEKKNLNLDCF